MTYSVHFSTTVDAGTPEEAALVARASIATSSNQTAKVMSPDGDVTKVFFSEITVHNEVDSRSVDGHVIVTFVPQYEDARDNVYDTGSGERYFDATPHFEFMSRAELFKALEDADDWQLGEDLVSSVVHLGHAGPWRIEYRSSLENYVNERYPDPESAGSGDIAPSPAP